MLKAITMKMKALPQAYKQILHPAIESTFNTAIIQPCKSLIRLHHLKRAYNPKYSLLTTLSNLPSLIP